MTRTLTLRNRFPGNSTIVENDFIDNYMAKANGDRQSTRANMAVGTNILTATNGMIQVYFIPNGIKEE